MHGHCFLLVVLSMASHLSPAASSRGWGMRPFKRRTLPLGSVRPRGRGPMGDRSRHFPAAPCTCALCQRPCRRALLRSRRDPPRTSPAGVASSPLQRSGRLPPPSLSFPSSPSPLLPEPRICMRCSKRVVGLKPPPRADSRRVAERSLHWDRAPTGGKSVAERKEGKPLHIIDSSLPAENAGLDTRQPQSACGLT